MGEAAITRTTDALFVRRVLIVVSLVAIAAVLWRVVGETWHALLTIFAGVLIGVLFDGLTRLTARVTRVPRWAALVLVGVVVVGLAALFWWWTGSALAEQADGIAQRVREAWVSVREWLQQSTPGRRLLREIQSYSPSSEVAGRLGGLVTSTLGALGTVLLIVLFGAYFAATPWMYVEGALHLFPRSGRARMRAVAVEMGRALWSWLLGRFLSALIVGAGTALGLWLVGIPMAVGLALIAAVLSFVPNVGPIVAAVPGLLVALTQGPVAMLWTLLVYVGVQAIDNYVTGPIINLRVVSLPPALLLAFQLLMGVTAGAIGLFMATPLAVVLIIAIQMLYLQDVLGEDVSLLGKESADEPEEQGARRTRPEASGPERREPESSSASRRPGAGGSTPAPARR